MVTVPSPLSVTRWSRSVPAYSIRNCRPLAGFAHVVVPVKRAPA